LKILVCGGRDFSDYSLVREVLGRFEGPVELAHGGARGADSLAGAYAISCGWTVRSFPADWAKHGKSAGPIRNAQMLREFTPDLVVAFPGGKGTAHMVGISRKAGVEVLEVRTT
jgi:hypothetical protein